MNSGLARRHSKLVTRIPRTEFGGSLKNLIANRILKTGYGVYTGTAALKDGPLRVLPLKPFLKALAAGDVLAGAAPPRREHDCPMRRGEDSTLGALAGRCWAETQVIEVFGFLVNAVVRSVSAPETSPSTMPRTAPSTRFNGLFGRTGLTPAWA